MLRKRTKAVVLGVDGLIPELVQRFADEGVLPNINVLLKHGTVARLTPYISTWGDTNFVAMLTGQAPGTSWIRQRESPVGTQHLLEGITASGGRTAFVHFPETLKPTGPRDLCFAPFWTASGPAPMEIAAPALHTTRPHPPAESVRQVLGWPPTSARLAHHQNHNQRSVQQSGDSFVASVDCHGADAVRLVLQRKGDNIASTTVCGKDLDLTVGCWSDWVTLKSGSRYGYVRFKLLSLDASTKTLELLQSQVTEPATLAADASLANNLIQTHGPFISKWAVPCSPSQPWYETSYEEGAYQLEWLVDTAATLLYDADFDLFATVFRLNDESHHTCLAQCDPESPFYDSAQAGKYLDAIRRTYEVLDKGVGRLLATCHEETAIVLASDHGDVPNRYVCDIYRHLAKCGLVELDENGEPNLEHSQVYLKDSRGGLEIFVNLRGRVPHGTVDPRDYARVQTAVIKSLNTWYYDTPGGEERVVAVAMSQTDARVMGYWGPHAGDVLFAYNGGFVWGTNSDGMDVVPAAQPGANHGPQIPTARTAFSSNQGLVAAYGSGVPQRGSLTRSGGLRRVDDVGAWLSRYLGVGEAVRLDGGARW